MADVKQNKEKFIQLEKDSILKIGIKDSDGNDTGNFLTFDLEDIELPLKINESNEMHKKNLQYLFNQKTILDKKEDKKGKKLLSWKQEQEIQLLRDFYKREAEALDMFLGKDGTKKMLNGRNFNYSMYDKILNELKPILPLLKQNGDNVIAKIKQKYTQKDEIEVLE